MDALHTDGEYKESGFDGKSPHGGAVGRPSSATGPPTIHGESVGTHFESDIWVPCSRPPLPGRLETCETNPTCSGAIYAPLDPANPTREIEVIQRVRRRRRYDK